MQVKINNALSKIFKILQTGELGKEQVINVSANIKCIDESLERQINALLCVASFTFNEQVKAQTVSVTEKPYRYGVLVREFKSGQIFKLFLRNAPIEEYIEINCYGSNAELFYDSRKNQITIYEQIPDTEGTNLDIENSEELILQEDFWECFLDKATINSNKDVTKQFLENNND